MARAILPLLLALLVHQGTYASDSPRHIARTARHVSSVTADAEVLRVKNTTKPAPARKSVQRTNVRKAAV